MGRQFATTSTKNKAACVYRRIEPHRIRVRRPGAPPGAKALGTVSSLWRRRTDGHPLLFLVPAPARPLRSDRISGKPIPIEKAAHLFLEPIALGGPRNGFLRFTWPGFARLVVFSWPFAVGNAPRHSTDLRWPGDAGHLAKTISSTSWWPAVRAFHGIALRLLYQERIRRRAAGIAFGQLAIFVWLLSLRFLPHVFWSSPIFLDALAPPRPNQSLFLERSLPNPSSHIAARQLAHIRQQLQ